MRHVGTMFINFYDGCNHSCTAQNVHAAIFVLSVGLCLYIANLIVTDVDSQLRRSRVLLGKTNQ